MSTTSDIPEIAGSILALAVSVERAVEALFVIVEFLSIFTDRTPQFMKKDTPEHDIWTKLKALLSLLLCVPIGIGFAKIEATYVPGLSVLPDAYVVIGAIAGFLAPYSHQIIELGFKAQKAVERTNSS